MENGSFGCHGDPTSRNNIAYNIAISQYNSSVQKTGEMT